MSRTEKRQEREGKRVGGGGGIEILSRWEGGAGLEAGRRQETPGPFTLAHTKLTEEEDYTSNQGLGNNKASPC